MRLINCVTHELEEFIGTNIPAYAILSHTLAEEEVTYHDFTSASRNWRSKEGAEKILKTCELALCESGNSLVHDQIKWVWVDTCCIDKSSSAELSEAINSMFEWYRDAACCFIWLSDYDEESFDLSECRWFRRGWTLQELIAPDIRHFYDQDWNYFGSCMRGKFGSDFNLTSVISNITRIPKDVLEDFYLGDVLRKYALCQKMNWAAGIFSINMPMLYGEGKRAFKRLQYEIMKEYNDLTILAWADDNVGAGGNVLANSPQDFANSHNIVRCSELPPEFAVTNRGLKIKDALIPMGERDGKYMWYLTLHCYRESGDQVLYSERNHRLGIVLVESRNPRHDSVYFRTQTDALLELNALSLITRQSNSGHTKTVYLLTSTNQL